jgi:hypothetical protein
MHRTIIVNQSLAASSSFSVNTQQNGISFIPSMVIIKQILYCNIAGADNGIFLLWSSLTSDNVAAFYTGIQGVSDTPATIIPLGLGSNYQNIAFHVSSANAVWANPTGQLTLTLEFIS